MMPVIAGQGWGTYWARMASLLFRLLTLLALVVMPLGMAGAPAAAEPVAAAHSGHCDDQRAPAQAPTHDATHCATCAGLPAMEPAVEPLPSQPRAEVQAPPARFLHGLHPDIATPPPKRS